MDVLVWARCFKRISNHTVEYNHVGCNVYVLIHCIKQGFEIFRVLVRVDDNHALEKHHLASTEQAECGFSTLTGIALLG